MKQIPITFMVSIALVVGGFLAPPTGVIDGKSIRVSKGDFSAEVNGGNE